MMYSGYMFYYVIMYFQSHSMISNDSCDHPVTIFNVVVVVVSNFFTFHLFPSNRCLGVVSSLFKYGRCDLYLQFKKTNFIKQVFDLILTNCYTYFDEIGFIICI